MAQLEYENVFISNYKVETCSKCERQTYIVNNTHMMCQECNCFRLHKKTFSELQKEKQAAYKQRQLKKSLLKKQNAPQGIKTHVPKTRIKQVSEKQKEINEKLKRVKDEITEHAFNTNSHYCVGCGINAITLDRSHILSVKHRPDLQLDKSNLQLLCRSCHNIWEHGKIDAQISLNCFLESAEYIYKNDSERFQKLFHKLLDYYEKVKYPSVLKLLKKIEALETEIEA